MNRGLTRGHGHRRHPAVICRAGGYTYLSLLFFVMLAGVGLAQYGVLWHTETLRDREKELLFVGEQFRRAIATYYEESPGGAKKFPASLEDLLEDNRTVTGRRHLRRIYPDPITGDTTWGLIKTPDGQHIMGVYSLSAHAPLKSAGFSARFAAFSGSRHYSDWKFAHSPGQPLEAGPATTPPQPPAVVEGGADPGAAPVLTPVVVGPVVAPGEPPKPKSRCEKIADSDRQTCERLGKRFDATTEADCLRTAQERAVACEQGKATLPTLYIRYF